MRVMLTPAPCFSVRQLLSIYALPSSASLGSVSERTIVVCVGAASIGPQGSAEVVLQPLEWKQHPVSGPG